MPPSQPRIAAAYAGVRSGPQGSALRPAQCPSQLQLCDRSETLRRGVPYLERLARVRSSEGRRNGESRANIRRLSTCGSTAVGGTAVVIGDFYDVAC